MRRCKNRSPTIFVLDGAEGSIQFDRTGRIMAPLQLGPGGYIGVFDVMAGSGWRQETAEKRPLSMKHRGVVGSRRERRGTPHDQWIISLPHRKITSNAQQYEQLLRTIQRKREAA